MRQPDDHESTHGKRQRSGLFARSKEAWERSQAQREARLADEAKKYGDLRASHHFGGLNVDIRSGGYVRVVPVFHGGPYQRLISITFDTDLSKKTGVGRGVGAVMTGGLNLLGSNKRGDVYLTIVTEERTYALKVDTPTDGAIRAGRTLAAVGSAVLEETAKSITQGELLVQPPAPTLRDRLLELERLLADGLITQAEYEGLRAKAISGE